MNIKQRDGKAAKVARRRCRNYFIKPAFQGKYLALVVVSVFLASTCMSFTLFGLLHHQARARALSMAPPNMGESTSTMLLFSAAYALILAVAFGLWSIILTHRIGGPLYVIEGYLAELTAGRFPRMRTLRKRDELRELHEAFRTAVEAMKANRQSDLAALTKAQNTATSAVNADDKSREGALLSISAQLEDVCDMLKESLGIESEKAPSRPAPSTKSLPRTPVAAM